LCTWHKEGSKKRKVDFYSRKSGHERRIKIGANESQANLKQGLGANGWVGLDCSPSKFYLNTIKSYLTWMYPSPGSSVSLGACEPFSGLLVGAQKMKY
jgi:hypothetical protein